MLVAGFWTVNLSIAFPVVKILLQGKTLQGYVEEELKAAERAGRWWTGVQQPVNTYSNLYAIVSAGYVTCRLWRDRRAGSAPPRG